MSIPLRAQYNNWQMWKLFVVCLCGLASLTVSSRASATGKHISCEFKASVNDGKGGHTSIQRTMNFYLDDTHSQLVGEGTDWAEDATLNVRTVTYSDTQIEAEISTGMTGAVADGMLFFGHVSESRASLTINRVAGTAAYGAKLLPRGAEVGIGSCHEVAPPPAKF